MFIVVYVSCGFYNTPLFKFFPFFHFLKSNSCDISVSKLQPISVGHVALGLSNGGLELYCRTKSEHITLLWTKVRPYDILYTCVHSVCKKLPSYFFALILQSVFEACEIREIRISEDEAYIGLGGGSGELIFRRISEDMVDNTAYIGLKRTLRQC
jgi:hypothetical protein